MTPEQFSKHLERMNAQLKKAVNETIPKIVANRATQMFKQNFKEEGFFGKKWKEVQRRQLHTVKYKTKGGKVKTKVVPVGKGKAGRNLILTGVPRPKQGHPGGLLGRSIRWKVEPGKAIVYSDVDYAVAHNEGTNNAGRTHNVHIPKRQFIGDHAKIQEMVKKTIEEQMGKLGK